MSQSELEAIEFADNPEPRCACVLLLDVSGSMSGDKINSLNQGLQAFQEDLKKDELASKRVEIAIVTFGDNVTLVQDFVTADEFKAPTLVASGSTPMGQAIQKSLDMIRERKASYKANEIAYYRPWIFMITDGEPTDEWEPAAKKVHAEEKKSSVAFFCVGVDDAEMKILNKISVRAPLRLKGLQFTDMFLWLSKSTQAVSHSKIGDQTPLTSPMGWAEILDMIEQKAS